MAEGTLDTDVFNIIMQGLRQTFTSADDADFISSLASFIESQILNDIPMNEITMNLRDTEPYKQRFAGNEARKLAGLQPLTEEQYLAQEAQYTNLLRANGLSELANRNTYAQLISGDVSAVELEQRVVNVYDRIRYADPDLKKELDRMRQFNITDKDVLKAMLTGEEGSRQLERKIALAELNAEATSRGLTSTMGAEDLLARGVNRQQASQGFEAVKQAKAGLEKLGSIYGQDVVGLQSELEKEQFSGLASQRRKNLTRQEAGTFSGKSGALTGQNISSSVGKI